MREPECSDHGVFLYGLERAEIHSHLEGRFMAWIFVIKVEDAVEDPPEGLLFTTDSPVLSLSLMPN